MPGMTGLEMIEKAQERFPEIVYIIFSGLNEIKYVQKAKGLGVLDYLEKRPDPTPDMDGLWALKETLGLACRAAESIHNGGHLESYYDYINNEISDTLSALDPTWKNEEDIKAILQGLSDVERAKVKAEICNTLTKIKGKLLNGDVLIHN